MIHRWCDWRQRAAQDEAPARHNPDLRLVRRRPTGPAGDLLTWDVRVRGALAVVAVGGELDIDSAPGLERELAPVADAGRHLILDLAGTVAALDQPVP